MANICEYKVIVKGKRNACMAFFGSMSCLDDKWIVSETGTDDEYTVFFQGDCKWSVDSYCNPWTGSFPVELPDDPDEAYQFAENNYWYHTVQERSKMFNVEVLCNSADIDDYTGDYFEHYINGKPVYDDCPQELVVDPDAEDDDDFVISTPSYPITRAIEGTGYEGRAARIEYIKVGDPLILKADNNSKYYSPVAIEVFNSANQTIGYLTDGFPSLASIAKDLDNLRAEVGTVTPLSQRSKRAKYPLLDVKITRK